MVSKTTPLPTRHDTRCLTRGEEWNLLRAETQRTNNCCSEMLLIYTARGEASVHTCTLKSRKADCASSPAEWGGL